MATFFNYRYIKQKSLRIYILCILAWSVLIGYLVNVNVRIAKLNLEKLYECELAKFQYTPSEYRIKKILNGSVEKKKMYDSFYNIYNHVDEDIEWVC